jgi:dipeptidyl aminopeptidase/acylaminoacyl peptidase
MKITKIILFILSVLTCYLFTQGKAVEQKRAVTFMDIIQMKSRGRRGSGDISPDGNWFVYTIRVPDWEKNRRYSDVYMTPLSGGKTKQMTFTRDKNEYSPKWFMDSSFFAFLSNRSDDKNQIYFMKADGSEARRVTDDRYGVSSYEWSRGGKYLAYLGGDSEDRQIWIMPGKGGKAEKLTSHKTPIRSFLWNPISKKIYFAAAVHLWEIDIETRKEKRLTGENKYSVSDMVISDDGTKIGFIGTSKTSEVYLLDLNSYNISQITNNSVEEWSLDFSPDGQWLAFIQEDGELVLNPWGKIYIVPTEGGETKKLLSNFEYYDWLSYFWSEDSECIYFTSQVGVDYCLFNVSLDDDRTKKTAQFSGEVWFREDKDSGKFLISYSDPENPAEYYCSAPENFVDRDKWIKITDVNPQVKGFLLGKYETVRWESSDRRTIEGLLIKPINYIEDKKYPLIVDIHGGPFAAETNRFKAHIQIYSANDYLVFQPNYRGSSGYGEKFKKDIAGDYFSLPLADIMTGVDYLIEREIVDPNRMGIMGWSAGGGICNWALVSTDRFKAISTGAASEIPKKHIKNAKTPTLIHCGENDRNNIRESEELYKTLKKLGVPTEFIVYPNSGHVIGVVEYGFGNMRQLMLEIQSDFYWFEKWIRGKEKGWIDCKEMIETLKKTGRIEEPLRKTSLN